MHMDMERSREAQRNRQSRENYRFPHEDHRRYSPRLPPSPRSYSRPSRTSHHYSNDNDYHSHSSSSHPSISFDRRNRANTNQINYSNTYSPSSRSHRSSDSHRPTHSTYLHEQSILSPNCLPSSSSSASSSYYNSSQSPSSLYIDAERNRYGSSTTAHRRDSPTFATPPVSFSYRNDRSTDYESRNNDFYMRTEYRPLTPPPPPPLFTSLSGRAQPYAESTRSNDYTSRPERYDLPSSRTSASARDYPVASIRNFDDLSMSRDEYYPERGDYQMASLFLHRPNLKRSSSTYDNDSIPSKRSMRR